MNTSGLNPISIVASLFIAVACAVGTAWWLSARAARAEGRGVEPVIFIAALFTAIASVFATGWFVRLYVADLLPIKWSLAVSVGCLILLAGISNLASRLAAGLVFLRYYSFAMMGLAAFYLLMWMNDFSGIVPRGDR